MYISFSQKNYLIFLFRINLFLKKSDSFEKRFIKIDIDKQSRGSSVPSFQLIGKELMYTKRAVSLLSANCVSKRWSD